MKPIYCPKAGNEYDTESYLVEDDAGQLTATIVDLSNMCVTFLQLDDSTLDTATCVQFNVLGVPITVLQVFTKQRCEFETVFTNQVEFAKCSGGGGLVQHYGTSGAMVLEFTQDSGHGTSSRNCLSVSRNFSDDHTKTARRIVRALKKKGNTVIKKYGYGIPNLDPLNDFYDKCMEALSVAFPLYHCGSMISAAQALSRGVGIVGRKDWK